MKHRFRITDVFTTSAFGGNQPVGPARAARHVI